jgi:ParB family transcriptional regulator, chromosome partitioning protein
MSMKKGLGRGFESLIPTDLLDESFDPTASDDHRVSELRNIKISEVGADPDQPRKHFDDAALAELTSSIKRHGVLQPIIVTAQNGKYQIVAGERRFRASKAAGLDKIPALVRTLTDQHKLELALIENLQRKNLNPLETATAYTKLRDQFNMTMEEIGNSVGGKSISSISNKLRLMRLPKVVKDAIVSGEITEGQARPLVDYDEKAAAELLPKIIAEKWSARMIEREMQTRKEQGTKGAQKKPVAYPQETETLSTRYNTQVRITSSQRGKGQIVIPFQSKDEFERLKKLLIE